MQGSNAEVIAWARDAGQTPRRLAADSDMWVVMMELANRLERECASVQ